MKSPLAYYQALICESGHLISGNCSDFPVESVKYCPRCGSPCISSCPSCGAPIHGDCYRRIPVYGPSRSSNIWSDEVVRCPAALIKHEDRFISSCHVPAYCHACGSPYPWTQILLDEASAIVDLMDELSPEQKDTLKRCFPDLLSDTPASPRASILASKLIHLSSTVAQTALQNLLSSYLCDFVLSLLGWKV